ncbi:MAG: GNAT family N-acetyltransferase [Chloroflexi bacterium]|nr:GNAT family N-acetyltransferase [Chloroflexota bacterium]MBV9131681.1 GNAT family N-acetyltransferase [Chloroflexota bacterium]MBV9896711.1 GNAT family N-acetyltransferase [Chloroflexota bacterium]
MNVPPIVSARLDLVSMSPEFMRASLAGDLRGAAELICAELPDTWPGRTGRTMRYRLVQLDADLTMQPWLLRGMVLREPVRGVIGHIGFHGPPDGRHALEVGYSVEPHYRRQGYALEAVQALFGWATREHGVHHFIANVAPNNLASLGLVRKLGFVQNGSQWDDEDGEELTFELLVR